MSKTSPSSLLSRLASESPETMQQLVTVLDNHAGQQLQQLTDQMLPEDHTQDSFSVPVEHVLQFLEHSLQLEYESLLTYQAMAGLVRGLWRDVVADEFLEHAEEEAEHIKQFTLWYAALGGGSMPQLQTKVPAIQYTSISDMIEVLIGQEQGAIDHYRKGLDFAGEVIGFKVDLEDIIAKEQEHINDLKAILPVPGDV